MSKEQFIGREFLLKERYKKVLKQKYLKVAEKLEKIIKTKYFMVGCFAAACLVTIFAGDVKTPEQMNIIIAGVIVFLAVICLILFSVRNLIYILLPTLLTSMFVLKCYDSFNTFIKFWWLAIPVAISFAFFLIRCRRKAPIGKTFWAVLAVAIAITLGGVNSLSAKEYFSGASLFYTIGLGFGMVLIYLMFNTYVIDEEDRSLKTVLANTMFFVCTFACFMIIEHYIAHIDLIIADPGVFEHIQWRNNLSTFIMISMPFVFFVSRKRPWATCIGVLSVFCLLLTGSRGGSIFGGIEFFMCVITVLIMDKKHRIVNGIIFGVFAILVLVFSRQLIAFFWAIINRTISVDENDQRWKLIMRSIEDFKAKPIFGRGLAYSGNANVYNPKKFAMHWYHCAPAQIIGSLGTVGVLGYLFQIGVYLRILWEGRSKFDFIVLLSFVGLWMMSCVNPGIFCPLPYAMLMTLFFTISEKFAETNRKSTKLDKINQKISNKICK